MSEPTTPGKTPTPLRAMTSGEGGSLGNITNDLADQIEDGTKGAVSSVTAAKAIPFLAGGIGALAGYLLIEPAAKLGKMAFGGLKSIVTGFGHFEKIPLVGFLFKGAGDALDTVGDVAGNILPVAAGVLGYKLFEAQDRTKLTPTSNIGRVGNPVTTEEIALTTPDTRPSTTVELPVVPNLPERSAEQVKAVTQITGTPNPTIIDAIATRHRLQTDENQRELDRIMQTYLGQEMQIYEDNRQFAQFTARDRERDTVNHVGMLFSQGQKHLVQTYGLTPEEAAAFIPKSPILRGTIYTGGDHQPNIAFSPLDDINYLNKGPLADFGREFQRTYGGLATVDNGHGKQIHLDFDRMSTSQQYEFLDKALAIAKKRKAAIIDELEYNAQQQGDWSRINGTSLFATNGSFNYMDMRNGPADTFYTARAYNELVYDVRTDLAARHDYDTPPPTGYVLKVIPGDRSKGLFGPTGFQSTPLPPYVIPRSVEHDFLIKVDGVGPNLTGELGVEIWPITTGSSHDEYDRRQISLGRLDGVTVTGEGNQQFAHFTRNNNANPNNLSAVFEQWQKDLQAHHEELGKGVAAFQQEKDIFLKVKMALLRDSGLAFINADIESPQHDRLHIVDTRTGTRYALRIDKEAGQITAFSSNGAPMRALPQPVSLDLSQTESFLQAVPMALAQAEPLVAEQQKQASLETSHIAILERGPLPAETGKPPAHYIIVQDASLPPGETPPQFRISYNANGEVLDLQVKEPGKTAFETTTVSRSLINKILQTRGTQSLEALGITPSEPAQLAAQLDFNATDPGQAARTLLTAYTTEIGLVRKRLRPAIPDAAEQLKRKDEAAAAGIAIIESGVGTYNPGGGKPEVDSLYVVARMLDDKKQPTGQTYKIYYHKDNGFVTRVERKENESDSFQPIDKVQLPDLNPWDPLESTCRHASLSIL